MKIIGVECLSVHSGGVKIMCLSSLKPTPASSEGGEAYSQYDRDRAVAAQVEELGRYLIGRDAFQIRHIFQIAFDYCA